MTDVDELDVDDMIHQQNGNGSNGATDVDDVLAMKRSKSMDEVYQQQIENLKEQLANKEHQMSDLQRGLEAQVAMVMELEKLEEKELQEYEAKLEANKKLIHELGERVGQESKTKAELESQLQYVQAKNKDYATQIERLEELNVVNTELLKAAKDERQKNDNNHQNNRNGDKNQQQQWEVFGKVEYLMETNQKLVMELAQAQEDIQRVRKDVSDKELLCLELSSQLDKLASQLNTADEDMALVKYQLKQKEEHLKKSDERVQMLEQALLQPKDGTQVDDSKGKAVLMRKLKDKEQMVAQTIKERDVSLAKATKLSLALASSREHVDALQEKLELQNSIVDRILGRSPSVPKINPNTNNNDAGNNHMVTPTKDKPRRHSSFERKKALADVEGTPNGGGEQQQQRRFDGSRIRNFFNRGRSNSNADAAVAAANNNNSNNSSSGGMSLFKRKTDANNDTNNNTNTSERNSNMDGSSSTSPDIVQPTADGKNTNPFDDDHNASFVNTSVGKESHIDEAVQGGGGDVNLALTI